MISAEVGVTPTVRDVACVRKLYLALRLTPISPRRCR